MSIRFAWSRYEFKSWISLLIFCLVDLSNIDSGVLKSPTIIVQESKSLCRSLKTCVMYLGAPVLGVYICRIVSSSCCFDFFYHYVMPSFISFDLCWFKIHFIRDQDGNSCFVLLSICLVNLPPSLYFETMWVLACEMSLLDTAHCWVLDFYPICQSVSFDWCIQSIYIQG